MPAEDVVASAAHMHGRLPQGWYNSAMGMLLMTVLAHPDDAEIWVGGTIRRHIQAGGHAACCILTGNEGTDRGAEAARGAAALGAEAILLAAPDRRLLPTADLVDQVSRLFRRLEPACIVTHWEDDTHPDHVSAYDVTRRAIVGTPGLSRSLRRVVVCDTYLGRGRGGLFTPDLTVDVTPVWEEKVAAIRAHRSQEPEQYVAAVERQCWLHGARAGVGYAEGFRTLPLYGRGGAALTHLI